MVEFKTIDGRRVALDEKSIIAVMENEKGEVCVKGKVSILTNVGVRVDVNEEYDNVVVCMGETGLIKPSNKVSYSYDDLCLPSIPLIEIDTSLFSRSAKNAWTRICNGIEEARASYELLKIRFDSISSSDERVKVLARMNTYKPMKDVVTVGDLIRYVRKHGSNELRKVAGIGYRASNTVYKVFEDFGYDKRGYKI